MHRSLRPFVTGLAVFSLAVLGIAGQGQLLADDVPAERRLPPGVFAFVNIPDAVDLKNRFLDSSTGQMLQDDSLEEFRAQFKEGWEKGSRELEEELGMSTDELLAIVDGDITLAVLQPPGRSFGGVLMLEFGDHREQLDMLLDKAAEAAEENDKFSRKIETVEDTEVTVYVNEGEDAQDGPNTVAYCIRDQHLLVSISSNIDVLADILVRWDGEHEQTFADNEAFSYIMQMARPQSGESSQIKWYFSPIDLYRAVATMPQLNRGGISPAMGLGFLPALGLDKFKAVGGATTIGTEEFDTVSRTFLYVNQPTSGLVRFFEAPATRQQPPAWVPANVSAYSSINWDIAGAYDAVEALVDFFQPPGTLDNLVNQLAQSGPQIHVKDDVIDSLTGRIQILGDPRGEVESESAQPGCFAFDLSNEDKVADILERLADFSDGQLDTRDFRGTTIYEMDLPNLQGGPQQSMGVAVAKGQLFVATDVLLLEEYIRSADAEQPLVDSPDYRRVSSHFPGATSIISFSRASAQLKPLYEQIRSGEFDALVNQGEDAIDFSTLPEFSELEGYFPVSGGYTVPDDNGALFVNFSLRKD